MKIFLFAWVIMSIIAYVVYAYDKMQAKRGGWRIPEKTLLLLSLCMGAPGALAGMYTLRHKTLKPKFTVTVPATLILQVVVFCLIAF